MEERIRECDYLYSQLVFNNYFSIEECKKIIRLWDISKSNKMGDTYLSVTTSELKFIYPNSETDWLFTKLWKLIEHTNNKNFNFRINPPNYLQILKYNKNDSFDWHHDIGLRNSSTRKISVISFLSDPQDYKGGKIIWLPESNNPDSLQEQGTVALFPSYIPHMITKVEEGVRYSLAAWAVGDAFQ